MMKIIDDLKKYRVFIWGYGRVGKATMLFLKKHGIVVEGIIDSFFSSERVNEEGILLLPPQNFENKDDIVVVVTSEKYKTEIMKQLQDFGFESNKVIDYLEIDSVGRTNEINRNNWIIDELQKLPLGTRLIDAGAGECRYKQYCKNIEYISQDFNQYDGTGDGKALQTGKWDYSRIDIVSDITQIPVEDQSFDAVLCSEVFEHIPSPENAIKEFGRILKIGGTLLLTAPFCSLTHFAPYHYATGFNRYWYNWVLDKYGFEIETISSNGNYFEYIAQELRRLESVINNYSEIQRGNQYEDALGYMLDMLREASDFDRGSNELLCHGYHIKAIKKKASSGI